MKVPFTVADFLDRAVLVYGDRVGVIDEPDVAGSIGSLTYAEMDARVRGMARRLEDLGIGVGDRVAIVSPNSAKFLISFWGTSKYGRVLVPINFRLNTEEIAYIIKHSGARVLLVDPEQYDVVKDIAVEKLIVLDGKDDAALFAPLGANEAEPTAWTPDEDATATINYTQRRADHAPQRVDERRDLWLARECERSRRVHTYAADVPLQRLGSDLRCHWYGRHPCRAAQGRRRRDSQPGSEAQNQLRLWCSGRRLHDARRRREACCER
jgi:fatty-acyl-CoA synthase